MDGGDRAAKPSYLSYCDYLGMKQAGSTYILKVSREGYADTATLLVVCTYCMRPKHHCQYGMEQFLIYSSTSDSRLTTTVQTSAVVLSTFGLRFTLKKSV